jgi:hypothetical protein
MDQVHFLHYTDYPDMGRIWFDDVVVAKSYIGPINIGSSGIAGVHSPQENRINFSTGPSALGHVRFDLTGLGADPFSIRVHDASGKQLWQWKSVLSSGARQIIWPQKPSQGLHLVVVEQGNTRMVGKFVPATGE